MLINSVVLFLRDALPVLLFISILSAVIQRSTGSLSWLLKAALFGVIGIVVLSAFIDQISQWFDGFGFELFTAIIHILAYVAVLLFLRLGSVVPASFAVSLLLSIHGTNLYIYSSGFWSSSSLNSPLLIGSILGFGISFSLALLLYYGLNSSLLERWPALPLAVLAVSAARQISEAAYFLTQADWLPTQQPLWNTSSWLSDSSEFGHLINALTGYEASPSAIGVTLHVIALLLPLLMIIKMKMNNPIVTEVNP